VQQASARTGDPPYADRNTTVRSDHSNFFPNDPWYHLLAPEALSRVLLVGHSLGGGVRIGVVEGAERLVRRDGQLEGSA
jgi:hypothetical protein